MADQRTNILGLENERRLAGADEGKNVDSDNFLATLGVR